MNDPWSYVIWYGLCAEGGFSGIIGHNVTVRDIIDFEYYGAWFWEDRE